ncbi:MAG TPA: arginase [Candidatus Limnocylindrales bacterium]|nr:arginase [Candidatus Limnocylindrales bacterium]
MGFTPDQPFTPRTIEIIGAPVDLGAGRRGVDMGPSAIRIADLEPRLEALGHRVTDSGDIDVMIPETLPVEADSLRYKTAILAACDALRVQVERIHGQGHTPLVLGGDHSIAIGSVAASSNHFARKSRPVGLIWFDAHGDSNTPETTPSGNIHGMSLAVSLGLGDAELVRLGGRAPKVKAKNTALIGVRDLDIGERRMLKESGVAVFTIREVDERGMRDIVGEAIRIASDGTAGIHLSFDMDVLDPEDAPGIGTPVPGGINYREAHLAMELLYESGGVVAVDFVEVNPVLDTRNSTGALAVELALSLFGKRIL